MAAINPYLHFVDKCEEAFDFYKSVFGGEFAMKMRFNQVPPGENPIPEEEANRIMHVSLPIGKGTVLMGSDGLSMYGPGTVGDNFSISLSTDNQEETDRLYNGLSEGGKITMPLAKTFWSESFGMFTDKFGVQWMINYDLNQQGNNQ